MSHSETPPPRSAIQSVTILCCKWLFVTVASFSNGSERPVRTAMSLADSLVRWLDRLSFLGCLVQDARLETPQPDLFPEAGDTVFLIENTIN